MSDSTRPIALFCPRLPPPRSSNADGEDRDDEGGAGVRAERTRADCAARVPVGELSSCGVAFLPTNFGFSRVFQWWRPRHARRSLTAVPSAPAVSVPSPAPFTSFDFSPTPGRAFQPSKRSRRARMSATETAGCCVNTRCLQVSTTRWVRTLLSGAAPAHGRLSGAFSALLKRPRRAADCAERTRCSCLAASYSLAHAAFPRPPRLPVPSTSQRCVMRTAEASRTLRWSR